MISSRIDFNKNYLYKNLNLIQLKKYISKVIPFDNDICPDNATPSGPTTTTSTPPTTTKQPGVSSITSQSKYLQKI